MKQGQKRPRAISAERLSLTVFPQSGQPMFTQIRDHVRDLIAGGALRPGMRLPPVRSLAQQLGVNQITVSKAYRELADSNLIEGRRGGGSFVRAPSMAVPARKTFDRVEPLLAERLFELSRAPGVIAFSSNYPRADHATIETFSACVKAAATETMEACFHYDPPLGRPALREQIKTYLATHGIAADNENILITAGGQQAIDLAVRALVPPGATAIVEQPAYYGVLNALRGVGANIVGVPLEADGMNIDVLKQHLMSGQVRLIYTNPTFQNPTGITMSEEKRRALLALARQYKAVIVEDDHSSELRFSGTPVPSIRALATPDDPVLYAKGLGKVFLPGSRIGYLVMPDSLRTDLLMAKAHADLHTNNLMQEAVTRYFAGGHQVATLKTLVSTYRKRHDELYKGLSAGMPEGTLIKRPEGGLSFWLTLPKGADVSELYYRAVRRGVAFVSGEVFYASRLDVESLRISFGLNEAGELSEGVKRLCSVVRDLLTRRAPRSAIMM